MSLLDGILAYWKYDEDTGTNVSDASGNGNNGNWQGTLGSQWIAGKINSGGGFNGTDNLVGTSFVLPSVGSISFWYKSSDNSVDRRIVGGEDSSGGHFGFGVSVNIGNHLYVIARNNSTSGDVDTGSAPATSSFEHLVSTWGSGGVRVYRNNVSAGSNGAITSITPNNIAFNMGAPGSGLAGKYSGLLDEVGIWGRELTLVDIGLLYNGGLGLGYPFGIGGSESSPLVNSVSSVIIQRQNKIVGY